MYIIQSKHRRYIIIKKCKIPLLIILLLCFVFIFLGCNSKIHDDKQNPPNPPRLITKANIEIIDWTSRLSNPPLYYYVEGILKNTGNKTADSIHIKIKAFDIDNKLVSLNSAYSEPYTLNPNQEATFQIMVENDSRIEKFGIDIIWQ